MERLDFDYEMSEAGIESSIHLARYSIAASLVKDKKVLDLACGIGYGAHFLSQLGAKQVVGIDKDSKTIEKANSLYKSSITSFFAGDVNDFIRENPGIEFDVIVSLETFEHVPNQTEFVQALKLLSGERTIVVISCPNDRWYYPSDDESNPYHVRKFSLSEFQEITVPVLGPNVEWYLGAPAFGFTTTPYKQSQEPFSRLPGSSIHFIPEVSSTLISAPITEAPTAENCSYFVGIWNLQSINIGNAYHPISMDIYAEMVRAKNGEFDELKHLVSNFQASNRQNDSELKESGKIQESIDSSSKVLKLKLEARTLENQFLRKQISNYFEKVEHLAESVEEKNELIFSLQSKLDLMQVGFQRYLKLTRFVPKPLARQLLRCKRLFLK